LCHAADGSGANWIGRFLEPQPPDMADPDTRLRLVGAARLRRVIRDGLTGTSMPAFGSALSDDEIDAVAAYILKAFLGSE